MTTLPRVPPLPVQRALRQEVGFGCPVPGCRKPFLTWHHFDPTWSVREHHEPAGMIALCQEHHDQADHGVFTDTQLRQLKAAGASAEPVSAPFWWTKSDIGFIVRLGGVYRNALGTCSSGGVPLLTTSRSESGLIEFAFDLRSEDDDVLVAIWENMFQCDPTLVHDLDVSVGSHHLKVWHKPRDIGLDLTFGRISIEELREMLAEDKKRAPEALLKSTPEQVANAPPELREALLSGDFIGYQVLQWGRRMASPDGIPFINVANYHNYWNKREVRIRSGIVAKGFTLFYGAIEGPHAPSPAKNAPNNPRWRTPIAPAQFQEGVIFKSLDALKCRLSDPFDSLRFQYGWGKGVGLDIVLFDLSMQSLRAGDVFVADAHNPNFSSFVSAVTDGASNFIIHRCEGPKGAAEGGAKEADYFHNDNSGGDGNDLIGYTIDKVVLRIHKVSYSPSLSGTSVMICFEVIFERAVAGPESAA